jgi:hypothetical protein
MLGTLTRPAGLAPSLAPLVGRPVAEVTGRLAALALGPEAARPARLIAEVWLAEGGGPAPDQAALGRLAGWVLAAPEFQAL